MKNLKKDFNLQKELLKKHRQGQKKYGAFSFLNDERDMKLEAADELIDAINYLVYLTIKRDKGEKEIKKWTVKKFNNEYEKYITQLEALPRRNIITQLINQINKLKK